MPLQSRDCEGAVSKSAGAALFRRTLLFLALFAFVVSGTPASTDADQDHDGLPDNFEQTLLLKFAPVFHISAGDCAGMPAEFQPGSVQPISLAVNGTIYGQVFRKGANIEVHYYHLWGKDCGNLGHALDAEHVSVLLSAPDQNAPVEQWRAAYWFAAAHQATLCELNSGSSATALHAEEQGAEVWISGGKHASFLTPALCGKGCGADSCAVMKTLHPPQIINIGEPGAPMNGAIWVNSAMWPMAAKMTSDFDGARLTALDAAGGLVLFRPAPSAQSIVSAGRVTAASIALGDRDTANALNTAGDHTDSALTKAQNHTANALGRAFQNTQKSLASSRQAIADFLSGKK